MKNQVFWDSCKAVDIVVEIPAEHAQQKIDAGEDGMIVRCIECGNAAVQLDNLYPYHQENCLCAEHINKGARL